MVANHLQSCLIILNLKQLQVVDFDQDPLNSIPTTLIFVQVLTLFNSTLSIS